MGKEARGRERVRGEGEGRAGKAEAARRAEGEQSCREAPFWNRGIIG